MPGRDGTGTAGQGPMSGRGFGVCKGANVSGYGARLGKGIGKGLGIGLVLGAGYGCRRGFRRFFTGGSSDKELLKEQKELLQGKIELIDKQLENLQEEHK